MLNRNVNLRNQSSNILKKARGVLQLEASSILRASEKLNETFVLVTRLISNCKSKLIVTGVGKSGQIGRKIASTFTSTGTPSIFLNPSESLHGDLGIISKDDILIAISQSGESEEIIEILKFAIRKGISIISLTGKLNSTLADMSLYSIDTSVEKEACPLGLAPTSSSTVALSLGDALAMSVLSLKGFKKEDFAEFHPGGFLGKRLLTKAKDLMHSGEALSLVSIEESLEKILEIMSTKEIKGVTGVIDQKGVLVGVITDGDLRRFFRSHRSTIKTEIRKKKKAFEIMSNNPKTIEKDQFAEKALFLMEKFKIQSLFVTDKIQSSGGVLYPIGVIHFQDLLKAGLK